MTEIADQRRPGSAMVRPRGEPGLPGIGTQPTYNPAPTTVARHPVVVAWRRTIIGGSAMRLPFRTAALVTLLTSSAAIAADLLPLKQGIYVPATRACRGASNA